MAHRHVYKQSLTGRSKCRLCSKKFRYDPRIQKGLYCSVGCRYKDHSNVVKSGYTDELKAKKSRLAMSQMKDPKQIAIRKEKCGYSFSDEQKSKMSEIKLKDDFLIAKKEVLEQRGQFCERCSVDISDLDLVIHHKDGRKWDNRHSNLQIL